MTNLPELLWDAEGGAHSTERAFLDLVYDELHRLASSLLRYERPTHTLQTSALVNEVFCGSRRRIPCPSRTASTSCVSPHVPCGRS